MGRMLETCGRFRLRPSRPEGTACMDSIMGWYSQLGDRWARRAAVREMCSQTRRSSLPPFLCRVCVACRHGVCHDTCVVCDLRVCHDPRCGITKYKNTSGSAVCTEIRVSLPSPPSLLRPTWSPTSPRHPSSTAIRPSVSSVRSAAPARRRHWRLTISPPRQSERPVRIRRFEPAISPP